MDYKRGQSGSFHPHSLRVIQNLSEYAGKSPLFYQNRKTSGFRCRCSCENEFCVNHYESRRFFLNSLMANLIFHREIRGLQQIRCRIFYSLKSWSRAVSETSTKQTDTSRGKLLPEYPEAGWW